MMKAWLVASNGVPQHVILHGQPDVVTLQILTILTPVMSEVHTTPRVNILHCCDSAMSRLTSPLLITFYVVVHVRASFRRTACFTVYSFPLLCSVNPRVEARHTLRCSSSRMGHCDFTGKSQ